MNEETKAKARGRLRRIEGQVQGLQRMLENDAYCVGKVERALRGVPGVGDAAVNLATERATVQWDPQRADVPALAAAVAAAGYELAEAPPAAAPGAAAEDREQLARAAEQRRLRAR